MSTMATHKLISDSARVETDEAQPVRVEIILNASAGSGGQEEARRTLVELFAAESDMEARVSLARSGEEIVALARQAAADREVQIVGAGGGGGAGQGAP